jgi:hypothetical protein
MNVGFLGSNKILTEHIKIIKSFDELSVVGIYESDNHELIKLTNKSKIDYYTDSEQFIDNCDVFFIYGKIEEFSNIIISLLKKSKHVFFYSPELNNSELIESILKISEESGSVITFSLDNFYDTILSHLRYITSPLLIEFEQSKYTKGLNFNDFLNKYLSYDIYLVLSLNNTSVKKFIPMIYKITDPDGWILLLTIDFINGSTCHLKYSNLPCNELFKIQVFQTNNKTDIDLKNKKLIKYNYIKKNNVIKYNIKKINIDNIDFMNERITSFLNHIKNRTNDNYKLGTYSEALKLIKQIEDLLII